MFYVCDIILLLFIAGESCIVHPPANQVGNEINVPLHPLKDYAVELHIKAYIGAKNSQSFHVFEVTRR